MIIRKYGIELHRLSKADIELVRTKRNSDAIRNNMFYREIITPEQQEKWFETTRNIHSYYFVIHHKGNKIGLIHGRNTDYEKRSSEGGIFIWDENYWSSIMPVVASIIMIEISFNIIGLDRTYAEVRSENERSKYYNAQLGYILVNEDKAAGKEVHVLTHENYLKKGIKIREAVRRLAKDDSTVSWDDLDFSNVAEEDIRLMYDPLPGYLKEEFSKRIS